MCPRPRTVEDEDVFAAVGRALARAGPLRMTLADVADEVGVTPSALVQRFGGKKPLLLAVVARGVDEVDARFAAARARHPASPLAALVDALAEGARTVETPEAMASALAFLQVDLTDPDFHRLTQAHFARLRAGLRALLADAARAGELSECDVDALARALVVTYNGSLLTWGVERDGGVVDALRRDLEAALAPRRRG